VIGITSSDVLFDVNSDSTSANLETNRLARTAQHLLQQRSYYPLFPGALGSNLNLSLMDQWKIPCSLDLLLIPSKLNPCVHRILDSTVYVNHGHLCKGNTGGLFAEIDVHPVSRELVEAAGGEDVEIKHNIQERVQIEIKRI
jgi:DNA polymerase alpha subunit B